MFFLDLLGVVIGLVLGGYILFAGRKATWPTLGIVSLVVTANLLAELVADADSGWTLVAAQAWNLVGIAFFMGVMGVVLGRYKPDAAVLLIGFLAGADATLWLYDISAYLITTVAHFSTRTALVVGLIVLFIGGLFGLWLVRKVRDEALILITMLVGVHFIEDALRLNTTSSWTAIIMIALALAGVLVQYAGYLRELKSEQTEPRPDLSSVAYFQDLELDV